MVSLIVELSCPQHGFERFRIKVVKRFNMHANEIKPRFRSRPKAGGLRCVYVGRDVTEKEIRNYLIDHFRRRGLWERILTMQFKSV